MDPLTFEATLEHLRRKAHPVYGFFGPESITWHLNREAALYLGGMRALLLQLAHPAVARGVALHSRYRQDPWGRALRTFRTVQTMLFGSTEEALTVARRTYEIHGYVRGNVMLAGKPRMFCARDEDLLLWVYATLVDSAMMAYETFITPLPRSTWEQAYEEGKILAQLFGLSLATLPPTLEAFETYMKHMLEGPVLQVTPEAKEITQALFREASWLRLMAPLNRLLAAAMLPEPLREAFELPWSGQRARAYRILQKGTRTLIPYLPSWLREIPAARKARRRLAYHPETNRLQPAA